MKVSLTLLAAQIAGMLLLFALALFLPAGTVAWFAGWAYLLLFFGFVVAITLWLSRHDPGLLQERVTGVAHPGHKGWDRALLALTAVLFFAWMVLMPLDAVRFGWSRMPAMLQGVGAILLLCSFCVFFLTFRENPYLSPAVRIQKERGQTVVSTGPYRYVRHPMYSGFIIWTVGTSLLLGSWWGLLAGLVLIGMVARRAVLEERTLRQELPGYDAYAARVKYRLVPHVW